MKLRYAAAICALALVTGAQLHAAPSAAANSAFETGIEAYRTGDIGAAVEAWTTSADGGHPMSAFLLGRLYEQGVGVEQSAYNSFKYYQMAADEGQAQAGVKVGRIYLTGNKELSIDRDYEAAIKYFEIGAMAAWPESQFMLADMYRRGLGVPADRTEGLRWLILAAKKKYAPSHLALASIYFEGEGVLMDRVKAWSYIELASRFADGEEGKQVNDAMDKYRKRMKPGEIEAARTEADNWTAEFIPN